MAANNEHSGDRSDDRTDGQTETTGNEQNDELVIVGQVQAPYGIKGWVHIRSHTVPPDNLLRYQPWFVGGVQRELLNVRPHGDGFVAEFKGIDERDAAARLATAPIAVPASALPALPEDEFYWRNLIGHRVVNLAGAELGVLVSFMSAGANDVMVVRDGEHERLVPFAARIVQEVDPALARILVDWGLDY